MRIVGTGDALHAFYSALASVEGVKKGEEADMGKYQVRYASLNAVHAEVERACQLHKLVVCQEPATHDGLFAVVTTLIHEDGSMIEFEPMGLPMPRDAQALGSATTYLRRYSLVSQFGIPVEDDDGQAATTSANTQPGRRTEAERMIRESMGQMHPAERTRFVEDFKREFGMNLSDLPANRHGDALTWSREWLATLNADLGPAPAVQAPQTAAEPTTAGAG